MKVTNIRIWGDLQDLKWGVMSNNRKSDLVSYIDESLTSAEQAAVREGNVLCTHNMFYKEQSIQLVNLI